MAIAVAMVMTAEDDQVQAAALTEDFYKRSPDLPKPSDVTQDDRIVSFKIGTDDVMLSRVRAPISWADLEGPCKTSLLWRTALQDVREHHFHHIVCVSAPLDPVALSGLLTRAVASALSALPSATGVYWVRAPLVVQSALFLDFATNVLPHGPPLQMWVDFRVWREESGTAAGFTSGMTELGVAEIEVPSAPELPSELYDRLLELASYAVSNPGAIRDGDTVGRDASEKIRVRFEPSRFGRTATVMVLSYESVYRVASAEGQPRHPAALCRDESGNLLLKLRRMSPPPGLADRCVKPLGHECDDQKLVA